MTAKTTTEIHGALSYVPSFTCVIMASMWYKILVPIDLCNKVIQARDATLDIEVQNIEELLQELIELRNNWKPIWHEAKLVASNLGIEVTLSRGRGGKKRKITQLQDELYDAMPDTDLSNIKEVESPEEAYFRKSVFYVMLDNVIAGLTVRFNAARKISQNFSFLWKYLTMSPQELEQASASMIHEYPKDHSHDIIQEMNHLPTVHRANFGSAQLTPLELLNFLMEYKLHQLFPNVCTCLRILLTIPATVASAERSFSKLKLIKTFLRSTMAQGRLVDLARLSIESSVARTIDFDDVIRNFARQKARKAPISFK